MMNNKGSLLLALLLLGLAACGDDPLSDLRSYVSEVQGRRLELEQGGQLQKKHELFAYRADSDGIRDPFATVVVAPSLSGQDAHKLAPPVRQAGELELIPLENFTLVGALEQRGKRVALVRNSGDGKVYQVRVGQYLGQNHGQVVDIQPRQLTLRELVPDGLGGWQARTATLGPAGK